MGTRDSSMHRWIRAGWHLVGRAKAQCRCGRAAQHSGHSTQGRAGASAAPTTHSPAPAAGEQRLAIATGPRSATPDSIDLAQIPNSAAFESDHPGFNKAYRAAIDDNPEVRRAALRCFEKLPPDVKSIQFSTVQTFTRTTARSASLTSVSFVSEAPHTEEYGRCLKDAMMTIRPTLLTDSDVDNEFQVKDDARLSLDRNPSPEEVVAKLDAIKQQMSRTSPDDNRYKILQQAYDTYTCYQTRHDMMACL